MKWAIVDIYLCAFKKPDYIFHDILDKPLPMQQGHKLYSF